MIEEVEAILIALLVAVAVLGAAARAVNIPYPIVLVVGGLGLGFVPGMPEATLEPDLVLVIFLPPLLYSAAFFANLHDLRRDLRAITLQAVGLVLVDDVRRRGGGARADPRPAVGGRLHARGDRGARPTRWRRRRSPGGWRCRGGSCRSSRARA